MLHEGMDCEEASNQQSFLDSFDGKGISEHVLCIQIIQSPSIFIHLNYNQLYIGSFAKANFLLLIRKEHLFIKFQKHLCLQFFSCLITYGIYNFEMRPQEKACGRFGLDPSKLEIEPLLKNRSYRRLYNIVANDQACSDSLFRPNLIRELYFLLQITPFIEKSLQGHFLNNIEEWYNSNDHKKIELSKNLQGKVNSLLKTHRDENPQARPKTGITWDTSLTPFLRPYTGKLRKNDKCSILDNEKENNGSTHAYTHESFIPENGNVKNVLDIEEQWERSQDFTKKHRTLHPEEEPTYEKLLSLIERLSEGQKNTNEHLLTKPKCERKIQSAFIKRQKTKQAAAEELAQMKGQIQGSDDGNIEEIDREDNQEEAHEQEDLEVEEIELDGVKCFSQDKRSRKGNKNRIYTRVNGLRIVRPLTGKELNIIEKLGAYSSLERHQSVGKSNEDEEFSSHHLLYNKYKTNLKRQISRKSESIRVLQSAEKNKIKKTIQTKQNIQLTPLINKSRVEMPQEQKQITKDMTHYSTNQFFQQVSKDKIKKALLPISQQSGKKQAFVEQSLTKNQRFGSELKFDPLNSICKDHYNEEILADIEKMKERFGGKINTCTDALMKALYIEAPIPDHAFRVPDKTYMMIRKGQKKKKKKVKKGNKSNKSKGKPKVR